MAADTATEQGVLSLKRVHFAAAEGGEKTSAKKFFRKIKKKT